MSDTSAAYQVFARKYRPVNFSQMIGQDVLVQSLTNAITSNRIAHAFLFTGVRGVGKTTTARILARCLNCKGAKNTLNGPTTEPCGVCDQCQSIAQDRNVDVLEMDAASRTGIEDIREILDGIKYAPVNGRYKIYIIDEVHMLSKNAFNALLKTLEEPPPHVVFIFATTELRKVPVTILSRCQKFDLKRVTTNQLQEYFAKLLEQENHSGDVEALQMIARAADGSVRDGLSLLDQALISGQGHISAETISKMLGLADQTLVINLLKSILTGAATDCFAILQQLWRLGSDPVIIVQDILAHLHALSRLSLDANAFDNDDLPLYWRQEGRDFIKTLSLSHLNRSWQIALKGLQEFDRAPDPHQALEMLCIRLLTAAHLPSPEDILRKLQAHPEITSYQPPAHITESSPFGSSPSSHASGAQRALATLPHNQPIWRNLSDVTADIAADLQESEQEYLLYRVKLISFRTGHIIFAPDPAMPASLPGKLGVLASHASGQRWLVSIDKGSSRSVSSAKTASATLHEEVTHPLFTHIREAFPQARIEDITHTRDIQDDGFTRGDEAFFDPESDMSPGADSDIDPDIDRE